MNKRNLCILAVIAAVFGLVLAGCFVESEPPEIQAGNPWGEPPYTGEVEGSNSGGYGGPITVKFSLLNGIIKTVDVTHNETASIGGRFIDTAKALIIQANSLDPIDGLTSPTAPATKPAFKEAGKAALNKIPGVELE